MKPTENLQDIYELSPLQQGMLFHTLHAPDSDVYFEQVRCSLRGRLDTQVFRRAWQHVLDRHDVLRASVHWQDLEKPYQIIDRNVTLPWREEDWSAISPEEQESRLILFLDGDKKAGFDLTLAPLMRVALLKFSDREHHLVWSFHHLLLDGWSLMIVLNEVFRSYEAFCEGKHPNLASVRPFRDYILWLQSQDHAQAEKFWRKSLAGFTAPVNLNLNLNRKEPGGESNYERIRIELSAALSTAIQNVARQNQMTPNIVVQSAWALLLSRYSGQSDVVWGTTFSGRPTSLPGSEQMVGLFINTLPLRAKLDPLEPLIAAMKRLQAMLVEVAEHEFTPLVSLRQWSEVPRSQELFETLVVFENYPMRDAVLKIGGELEIHNPRAFERANYPLSLVVIPGSPMSLEFYYESKRFDAQTVSGMLRHLQGLLESITVNPDQAVRDVQMLSEAEYTEIVSDWNRTYGSFEDRQSCIHQLFERYAAQHPEKTAVRLEGSELNYGDLNAQANQLAHFLRGRGVGPDTLVGLCVERSFSALVGLLGILKAGGAYVPFDPSYPPDRVQYMVEDAGLKIVVTQRRLIDRLAQSQVEIIALDASSTNVASEPVENPGVELRPSNLAYVIYTSGSTGRPKGVLIEHGGLANLMEAQLRAFDLRRDDQVFQFASLAYDASIFEIAMAIKTGATIVLASTEATLSPQALFQQLSNQRVTNLTIPPSVLAALPAGNLPDLKTIIVAGEACAADLVTVWAPGRRFFNAYGPTETTVWASAAECFAGTRRPPIGRPILNTQIYLLDAALHPVPVGVVGELHIGGAGLARGYLNRQELTAERFVTNPFAANQSARLYKSGDLARYLPDGNIEYIGRIDHQVKIRGFRVELEEIEAVLAQCPGVKESAVLVRQEETGDRRLVAYLVIDSVKPPTIPKIREHLKARVPQFMVPAVFVVMETMPLTVNGKINRRALPAPDSAQRSASLAPENELEQKIAEVWRQILQVDQISRDDNFFDLGGHSLLMTQAQTKLRRALGRDVRIVDLFTHPTLRSLAAHLLPPQEPDSALPEAAIAHPECEPIAVVGLAGRFPSAPNIEKFWEKLRNGEECIRQFSDEELLAAGVDPVVLSQPNYVKAGSLLEDVDKFDAQFFGFNPREAEATDPQHRIFLETAHQALENAGIDPQTYPGRISVYGGTTSSSYMMNNLLQNPDAIGAISEYQIGIGNHKDFLSTRVSYKLNLTGPSIDVQATCCTSLVAIHMGCQSLWSNESEVALAGGVTVSFPHPSGYFCQEEGILSPDGHCRTFDIKAKGTVPGSGAGIVVLKRLSRAQADGDTIYAVIRSSATNNDGSSKVGYTAPSVEGQAAVITAAHRKAGISAESVTYVEAHGTATPLGDPIEIAALTQAFRRSTQKTQFCAIGSVKSSTGHLDSAAGVAGFLKTVLQLKHRQLVASLNFEKPNPKLDLEASPFFVNQRLREWESDNKLRRAGVSSFGIGGTNVHVILEEAPSVETTAPKREWQLLTFSAKTPTALETMTAEAAAFLGANRQSDIADVAYTLHVGRSAHQNRRFILVRSSEDAAKALFPINAKRVLSSSEANVERAIVFLFPGQGSQYVNMGRDLYEKETVFRQVVDECCDKVACHAGVDLRTLLFPCASQSEEAAQQLKLTCHTQPALFIIEYALAKLWISWGVRPQAMMGHSIGEYVAACLAGVFSLDDALKLVAARGRMMQDLPSGAMLALPLSEARARTLLPPGISIAAINAPSMCVASGPHELIDELESRCVEQRIESKHLQTSHAFHSSMMEPVFGNFGAFVRQVKRNVPKMPYISNVTGTWITAEEAVDPEYWIRHMRQTVRFSDGLMEILKGEPRILLEVGPGQTLTTIVRQHQEKTAKQVILASLRHVNSSESDQLFLLNTLGKLWLSGARIDWQALHAGEKRARIPLPTYPFERRRYFIEPKKHALAKVTDSPKRRLDVTDWFYVPSWRRSPLPTAKPSAALGKWLIFADDRVASCFEQRLCSVASSVTVVRPGGRFSRSGREFEIQPHRGQDYLQLLKTLASEDELPDNVVHLWNLEHLSDPLANSEVEHALNTGFLSLMFLAQALGQYASDHPIQITVAANDLQDVTGDESLNPAKSALLGIARVLPQELSTLNVRTVDFGSDLTSHFIAERLFLEAVTQSRDSVISYRGSRRWIPTFEAFPLAAESAPSNVLRHRGVYLITGGMGGMGLVFARYLAEKFQARLILLGRTGFPARDEWESYLASNGEEVNTSQKIHELQAIETLGGEVLVASADVTSLAQMRTVLARAKSRFGAVNGVIHAAGLPGGENIQTKSVVSARKIMSPKIEGTLVLHELFAGRVDFIVLCSSLASVAAAFGQSDYSAANAFLDAYAHHLNKLGQRVVSINWDNWGDIGMAVNTKMPTHLEALRRQKLQEAIRSTEGVEAFVRVLRCGEPQVFVSTKDLNAIMAQMADAPAPSGELAPAQTESKNEYYPRPSLQTPYVEALTETESRLVVVWEELLGVRPVGIHDNFFDLGGHSLLGTQLVSRVHQALHYQMPLRQLFECPTVAQLAELIPRSKTVFEDVDAELLKRVEEMGEEQVQAELEQRLQARKGAANG